MVHVECMNVVGCVQQIYGYGVRRNFCTILLNKSEESVSGHEDLNYVSFDRY
jgi:hypothetical protein